MKTMLKLFIFVPSILFAGELADLFEKQAGNNTEGIEDSRNRDEMASEDHGITEIGLERTICFGVCPAYTVIIKNDGSFKYTGYEYVDKSGNHTGTVPKWELNILLQFINDSKYDSLQNSYEIGITCQATVYTMVKKNGITKIVSNYANAGPTNLWAIEQLIDNLLLKAEWD